MSLFSGNEKEIENLKKEHQFSLDMNRIRYEEWKLSESKEIQSPLKEMEAEIADLKSELEHEKNALANIKSQLTYERENRQVLIDAAIQKELGQYETKYMHDLHDGLEKRADGMQKFQETFFDKLLGTLKEFKSPEPKVMILGKEVFGADAKAQQNEKKAN